MGSGPGPHGKVVGTVKCVSKQTDDKTKKALCMFASADKTIHVSALLKPEDAGYFTEGASYALSFTTP
jgi:hypothetical protein